MVRLSARAVFRLMTSSNFVGRSTGISAAFAPLKASIADDILRERHSRDHSSHLIRVRAAQRRMPDLEEDNTVVVGYRLLLICWHCAPPVGAPEGKSRVRPSGTAFRAATLDPRRQTTAALLC